MYHGTVRLSLTKEELAVCAVHFAANPRFIGQHNALAGGCTWHTQAANYKTSVYLRFNFGTSEARAEDVT